MIPRAHITAWRSIAPWSTDAQVEQDLVLSRALVEIYTDPALASSLAFRGGTALHKLYLSPALRYSEDYRPRTNRCRRNRAGHVLSARAARPVAGRTAPQAVRGPDDIHLSV